MPRFRSLRPRSAGSRTAGSRAVGSCAAGGGSRPSSLRVDSAITLAAFGLVVTSLLSGCAVMEEFGSHQKEQVFATWADAPQGEDVPFAPPSFVPEDATEVRMRMITNGPGELLRWAGATPVTEKHCDEGPLVGAPLLESTWWPAQLPNEGIVCAAGWQLFQKDGYTYGWASV